MRTLIERLVGSLWAVLAAIVIFFAVVISVARLALPEIDEQRDAIAEWIGAFIERPVQIGKVEASWRGWTPSIHISELVLLDENSHSELVRFDYGSIDIALFRSILEVTLIPRRLVVGGMRVALERDAEGNIKIAGMPPSRWPVAQWILGQENFTLTDAIVSFSDVTSDKPPTEFSNVTLTVSEENKLQLIQGRLLRQDLLAEVYEFALRVDGDVLGSDWNGDLFVEVSDGDIRSAMALTGVPADHIDSGAVHGRLWSHWEDAKLRHAAIEIDATDITVLTECDKRIIERIDVDGALARIADGWWFDVDHLQIDTDDNPPGPAGRLAARLRSSDDSEPVVAFRADSVNVGEVAALLPEPVPGAGDRKWSLEEFHLDGMLHDVLGSWSSTTDAPRYYIEANVDKLAVAESRWGPSVRGLDFTIRANNNGGTVDIQHTAGVVLGGENFVEAPVEIQKIDGAVEWEHRDGVSRFASQRFDIRAEGIEFSTRGMLTIEPGKTPFVDAAARIVSGPLANIGALVPKGKLRPRGDRWIRTAFKSGRIEESDLVFRGHVGDFPFRNREGTLKAHLEVRDVDLRYSTRWPITTGVNAAIEIENATVKSLVREGSMYSSSLADSTVEMPDLLSRKPVVRVQGAISVTADELDRFINESPLKATKAVRFLDVDIDGKFGMTLDMNLGIYPGGDKDILGLAQFAGNRIDAPLQNLTLEDVHGDISFTRQDWYGEGIRAVYDGDRVGVVLNGGLDDPNYDTEFRMTGTSDAPQLLKMINLYAPLLGTLITRNGQHESLHGELPWKVVLTIPQAHPDGRTAPKRLTIDSSLVGLDLDLPWPFSKKPAEQKPLSVLTETSASGERLIRVDLGTTVDLEFDQTRRDDGTFETRRAEIIFGQEKPAFGGKPGLSASGNIGRLPLNEWAAFARAAVETMGGDRSGFPTEFDIHVDNLEVLGRTFPDARLSGAKSPSTWDVAISSPQLLGTIKVPRKQPDEPLIFDFDRMWLTEKIDPDGTTEIDPRIIPRLELVADSLHFGDLDLGRAEVTTSRDPDGLKLDRLKFSHADFNLTGDGDWILQGNAHRSQVHLDVRGDSLAGLLAGFNYAVANIDGGTTAITIDALWAGMPSEFTLDKLQGSFTLSVDKGRFLDIDPGGGRLFGLLSLQTLPRRLSLDFNDLFKKGFSFDRIEGAFMLDHGNAYTNSLLMDGPAARIELSGRTGLADQDYDQRVTVTPALSDTIPIAGAFFGPAGIGVGAVIYLGQKMFKSIPKQVDKFLSREYSITGAWSRPVIERI